MVKKPCLQCLCSHPDAGQLPSSSQALVYQGGLLSQTKPQQYSQCMCLL